MYYPHFKKSLLFHIFRLQELGLEKGWGNTAKCALDMIHLLLEILQAPDPATLENFLGRIPMVFNAGRAKYKFASFWNRNHALRGLQRANKKFGDLQEQIKKARKLSCRFCDRCGLIFGNSLHAST